MIDSTSIEIKIDAGKKFLSIGASMQRLSLPHICGAKYLFLSIVVFSVFLGNATYCYGQITRKEVVSANLDYYTLKSSSDAEKGKIQEFENKVLEEKKLKKEMQQNANKERLAAAGKFVKRGLDDIRLSVLEETRYEDNLYRTHDNQVNAFITTVDVGMAYTPRIPWRKGHTSAALSFNAGPSTHVTTRRTFAKVKGGFKFALAHKRNKYDFAVNYGISKDYSTANEIKTGAILPESLIEYFRQEYGARIYMDWKNLPTEISYSNQASTYEKRYKSSDTITHTASITNYFNLFPKTRFLFSYDYEVDKYPKRVEVDSFANTFWWGIRGKISPKINGLTKFGYKFSKVETGENLETETVKTQLDYQMLNRLVHIIDIERNISVTSLEDETWARTNKFGLSSLYSPIFSERMKFGLDATYTDYEYSSGRKDDLYEWGVHSDYIFKNQLSLSLGYRYTHNSSSIKSSTYSAQAISLKVKKEF
ncbi:MAG: outer membrane beta-barrel protein [Candidatus Omnitrophica bacterium]|nr:outer membrane beta-barrel protein [Candidatus Omnitrophota bacterium]